MKRELKERLVRLGPSPDIGRVRSGSSGDVVIRTTGTDLRHIKTIDAIQALVRRGVNLRIAKRAIEHLVEFRAEPVLHIPTIEKGDGFSREMKAAGLQVHRLVKPKQTDVRGLRERLGFRSAAAFAKRYGLNARTVEGWEQGRPIDDAANTYLFAIAANPKLIGEALEEDIE